MNQTPDFAEYVQKLSQCHVLCVGDVILDCYVHGEVNRVSPEAPVGILQVRNEHSMLGGGGNVVRNVCALGAEVTFLSVTGEDEEAVAISSYLQEGKRCRAVLRRETNRHTSLKRRYVCQGQQLLRADRESTSAIRKETLDLLLSDFVRVLPTCDVVVLSDYAKGVLVHDHALRFIEAARAAGKPVIVDPKGINFERYRNATILKPNLKELSEATGIALRGDASVVAAAERVIAETGVRSVVVTRGAAGITLVSRESEPKHFPSEAREVFDVSGAGDTVAATMACAVGIGVPLSDAIYLANIAAGLVVAKAGTAVVDTQDLLQEINRQPLTRDFRIKNLEDGAMQVHQWHRKGLNVGLVTGCFDLLQMSDIAFLQNARRECDRLIIAVESDSMAEPVSHSKPVRDQMTRATILAAMSFVDLVIALDEIRTDSLVSRLLPDTLIEADCNGAGAAFRSTAVCTLGKELATQ